MQNSIKIPREEEHAWSIGFGALDLKIEFSFRPVDLSSLERTDFPHSHAAVVCEARGDLRIIGQRASEREKVFMLERA
jgi:hypothetical protein